MATLETRTAKLNIIISLAKHNVSLETLKTWCENNMQTFAFILHDKDVLEDGKPKVKHIHLVGLYKTARTRLGTILTDLANYLKIDTLAVSIDKMSDLVGSLHYLIHKDNKDKHQYDVKEIITNISEGEMATYMVSDSKFMSIEYLIGVVNTSNGLIEVMRSIGLSNYHMYRNVILDIWRELKTGTYGLS